MTVWVTATVLQVLAAHQQGCVGATFTAAELALWVEGQISQEQRVHATSRLCALGFLAHSMHRVDGEQQDRYCVTADGAAAVAEAAKGQVRKSGPKTTRAPNPHQPESLVVRLWALLRMRSMLDSDSAARTLCNAGDADFATVQASVRKYLRRWAKAGALAESSRRVKPSGTSNGCKRYVLQPEWKGSAEPPRWRAIARQETQA